MSDTTHTINTPAQDAPIVKMRRLSVTIGRGDDKVLTSVQVSEAMFFDASTVADAKREIRDGFSEEASIARGILSDTISENRDETRRMMRSIVKPAEGESRAAFALRRAATLKQVVKFAPGKLMR